VTSRVPAAPLLPETTAVRARVAHRAGPAATLVVDPGDVVPVVDPGVRVVVVDAPPEDADPPGVVDGEFEEHAPRRPPAIRMPPSAVTSRRELPSDPVTLVERLRRWAGPPGRGAP
jgi:hypothetical protein